MTLTYEPVIGLETHVQLRTKTKMFCPCPNVFGAEPNSVTCPVCIGAPGALPVANREAFHLAILVGSALEAEIGQLGHFDRKNYFYPDLPKGYQITQLDRPVIRNGRLHLPTGRTIPIVRAHLEEDAGKLFHVDGARKSLVDLNRCGIPLLEIVTDPAIRSAKEAHEYLSELKLILRHLGVSECDMEKGSLRCDVNVSIRPEGTNALGTRVELKNLNSFKAVERAILAEVVRQISILDAGGSVTQETRSWNDEKGTSKLLRRKEDSLDYRYFRDPDLPVYDLGSETIEAVRRRQPELPRKRAERFQSILGLSAYDADLLIQEPKIANYFEDVARICQDPKAAANWITTEVFRWLSGSRELEDSRVDAASLARLIKLVNNGTLNVGAGRKVLETMLGKGGDPEVLATELGLIQLSDEAPLLELLKAALAKNPKAEADLRAGKWKASGAVVGEVMRSTSGRANPGLLQELLRRLVQD